MDRKLDEKLISVLENEGGICVESSMTRHKFKLQRNLVQEIQLEIDLPDNMCEFDIFHTVKQLAKDSDCWETILVDRPEFIESSVNFGQLL